MRLPLYTMAGTTGAAIDYMHWQIPLSRRFRALKLWFVIRSFGVEGLQAHVRKGVVLAEKFEKMVRLDERFEIPAARHLGMVVFRLKEDNDRTEILLKRLNKSGKIHMVPAALKSKYVIRFTVTSQYTTDVDIERDWKIIQDMATKVLRNEESDEDDVFEETQPIPVVIEPEVLKRVPSLKKKDYGMSLLLSNVPSSPKLINGSFAALFDNNDVIVEFAKEITNSDFNGRPIRLSPRRRMKLRDQNRQRSLDCDVTPHRSIISRFKQASLDSKVDEILEWSTLQEQTGGLHEIEDGSESGADSEFDAGSGVKMKVSINVSKSSETDDEPEIDKGELPNGNGFHSTNESVNGHIICKHCGHVING